MPISARMRSAVLLDADEVFLRQDVVGRDVADDIGPAEPFRAMRALLAPGRATAARSRRLPPAPQPFRPQRHVLLRTVLSRRLQAEGRAVTLENLYRLYKLSLCKAFAICCRPPAR